MTSSNTIKTMDSLQFLIQLRLTRVIDPGELDELVSKLEQLLDRTIGDGDLDTDTAEVYDYDLQFERYD